MVLDDKKGITLIALVITIIVMLILAAVTISMVTNGGLFGYAGNATSKTSKARDEEKNLSNLEANLSYQELIAKYASGISDLTGTTWRFSPTTTWNDLYDDVLFNGCEPTSDEHYRYMTFNFTSTVKVKRALTNEEAEAYAEYMTGERSGDAFDQTKAYLLSLNSGDTGYINCYKFEIPDGKVGMDFACRVSDGDQLGLAFFGVNNYGEYNSCWLQVPYYVRDMYGTIVDESTCDITITGGEDAKNLALIHWFQTHATQVE